MNLRGGFDRFYGVDINEDNVTIYEHPAGRALTIATNLSKVVLGYAYRRKRIQEKWGKAYGVKGNRRLRAALRRLRERSVKRGVKLKLAKAIVGIARGRPGVVVLERLPKRFQATVLNGNGRLHGLDVHRLMQSGIRGMQRIMIEKLEEHGIPHVLVNPAHTSTACPVCGARLAPVTGGAQRGGWRPRLMRCPRCGFTHYRDVIAAVNLAREVPVRCGGLCRLPPERCP